MCRLHIVRKVSNKICKLPSCKDWQHRRRAGKPTQFVKEKIERAIRVNDIPEDALIEVKQNGKVLQAHVSYTQTINILPFGIYKYDYIFDHTATPTGFLLRDEK